MINGDVLSWWIFPNLLKMWMVKHVGKAVLVEVGIDRRLKIFSRCHQSYL